ncbi:MAG: sll0787 family AIR synthase-like protein [bacterium]
MKLSRLVDQLKNQYPWEQKQFIQELSASWSSHVQTADGRDVMLGDDAAAIPSKGSYLLLASELILPDLVQNKPEMAGRSAVLANVNDIYAMGGRPVAIQDVMLSSNAEHVDRLQNGLDEGSRRYDVPVVGGHLTKNESAPVLGASILGEAENLLSSSQVESGQKLLVATHLQGEFRTGYSFWSCTEHRSNTEIRGDLSLLAELAEDELCSAAKDISMAGLIGTILMLLEPTSSGADIDLPSIPSPAEAENRLLDWLTAFPSYGFVLAVDPGTVETVQTRFDERSITCEVVGTVTDTARVVLGDGADRETVWDFSKSPFTGFG